MYTQSDGKPSDAIGERFVIISGYHDYRSKRKVNLHFIAEELSSRGDTFFLSLRYSSLSRYRADPRVDLWERSNRLEVVDDVNCYLWRTPVHPFGLPPYLGSVEKLCFELFTRNFPPQAWAYVDKADRIFIESGIGIVLVPAIKKRNPSAQIVYMASDSLEIIQQAGTIKDSFCKFARLFDFAAVPSPFLRDEIPAVIPCCNVPHGIDKRAFSNIGSSPYRTGSLNAVSVGSMLFDPNFFKVAAEIFPDICFHVIGSGQSRWEAANIVFYGEMPFEQTLPYLRHSNFAIAAYRGDVPRYLTHTSMKLAQYNFLQKPAVCPDSITGEGYGRFGYKQGDPETIKDSILRAMDHEHVSAQPFLDWKQVTERLLHGTNAEPRTC